MRRGLLITLIAALAAASAAGQTRPSTRKPAAKKPASPAAPAPKSVAAPASVTCPHVLGTGAGSKLQFCDVLTGRNPADGVLIHLPAHKGVLTLTFDLHNRHTYSEEMTRSGRAYANYTATIGVLTLDGTLLGRGVVRSEFRSARDLLDRIDGGAGPGGVKAVAPIGNERITVEVPEDVAEVSLLGERLSVVTLNGTETFTAAQRPIAAVSNVNVEYQPAPKTAKPTPKKGPVRKK